MARINIEDEFFEDVASVAAKMGDLDRAHGQALRLIRWSQLQTKSGKGTTYAEFQRKGFSDDLFPEFGSREGDYVIVRGAKNHFAWLEQKAEAGSKGGRSKTEAKTKHLKQNRSKTEAKASETSATEASFSSSISISSSDSVLVPSEPTKASAFVKMYCEGFKRRWGESPQILGKDAGIAKRLAKDLSPDRFAYLLDAYFSMPDAWLVKTKHPLGAFETKLNEIVVFADSGQFTTQTQVRQADQMATNHLLMEKLKREGK